MRTLVVVPTAGNCLSRQENGWLEPSENGQLRLEKAAQLLKGNPNWGLAIVGGRRKDPEETEAMVANTYMWEHHQDLGGQIELTLDSHKCTVPDMVELAENIKSGELREFFLGPSGNDVLEIVIVTHPNHCQIARIPLRKLLPTAEIRCEPSGEGKPYSDRMQAILLWVTQRDPLWQGLWSWPFRLFASRRENPPLEFDEQALSA